MPMHLDHFQLSTRNIYESAQRLRDETGLGFYDGGHFPGAGLASKVFPLGAGAYLSVEGVVDAGAIRSVPSAKAFHDRTKAGECFSLVAMRVDKLDELKKIAARHHAKIPSRPAVRIRPDGPPVEAYATPPGASQRGRINWYCHEDRINHHPAGQPVAYWHGLVQPTGIAWLEVGGTEAEMDEWLGIRASQFPFRYNGKPHGLYAIGVKSDQREIAIRRPWRV